MDSGDNATVEASRARFNVPKSQSGGMGAETWQEADPFLAALVEVRSTNNSVGNLNQLCIGAGGWQNVRKTIERVNIRNTIAVINQMQADGVIERYAIGDAVGATFYLEPVATLDVDVFITLHPEAGSLLANPQPIFDYLKARGGTMEGEYIVVAGWPVQFLPATGPLVGEALAQAVEKDVAGTSACVFTAEHLAAIALQTGRAKDKARLLQFVETGALDPARFQAILCRHGLQEAWQCFEKQFLGDTP